MSVVVVGSVALDTIKTPKGRVIDILGGSAVYSSLSAVFFSPVSIVAVVGEDFPQKHISTLKKKGVDLTGLVIERGSTFRWEGEYGEDFADPKTIATHLNVFADFNPRIPAVHRKSQHLFLANIDPDLQESVLDQMPMTKIVACDTMNYWIENKRRSLLRLLKKVDIFLLNASELKQLTQTSNLIKAGKELLGLGPKAVIVKKGEHGILIFSAGGIFAAPAFMLEDICDPTGAGDTFAGGLIGYLASCGRFNQQVLRKAAIYGMVMATFAVEDFSLDRLAKIRRSDIDRRIKLYKKFTDYREL